MVGGSGMVAPPQPCQPSDTSLVTSAPCRKLHIKIDWTVPKIMKIPDCILWTSLGIATCFSRQPTPAVDLPVYRNRKLLTPPPVELFWLHERVSESPSVQWGKIMHFSWSLILSTVILPGLESFPNLQQSSSYVICIAPKNLPRCNQPAALLLTLLRHANPCMFAQSELVWSATVSAIKKNVFCCATKKNLEVETRGKQPHLSMQFYTQVNWCLLDFNCAILQKQLVGREVCNMCTFCLTFSRLRKIMESLHAARFFHVNKQEDLKDSG